MSFKRDGNDANVLNLLQQRRVSELLAANIPTDEALLIKNGKFACLVCSNRPVLDTVQMLTMHRCGKKHLEAAQDFNHKANGSLKGDVHTGKIGILKKPDYDHRIPMSKRRSKPYEFKKDSSVREESNKNEELKSLRKEVDNNHHILNLKPYQSKCKIAPTFTPPVLYHKQDLLSGNISEVMNNNAIDQSANADCISETHYSDSKEVKHLGDIKTSQLSQSQKESYLKLLESGWKRSRDGKWIKDENVEFDSDEDTPSL